MTNITNSNEPIAGTERIRPIITPDPKDATDMEHPTSDEVFDQLMDEDRVVTSGMGTRLPRAESVDGSTTTGYSAGGGSGTGSDG